MAINSNNIFGGGPKDVEKFWDYVSLGEIGTAGAPLDWKVDAISTGTIAGMTTSPCVNGILKMAGAATTDDSGINRQTLPVLDLEANQYASCAERASLAYSASVGDWLMGFCAYDQSLIGGVSDGIYLVKANGGTVMSLKVNRDSSIVSVDVDTAVDTAFHTWGIQVESRGSQKAQITVYRDGTLIHQGDYTNVPDDEVLCFSSAWQSGSATSTQFCYVDWDRVRIRRVAN